jgi:hypothetical protein
MKSLNLSSTSLRAWIAASLVLGAGFASTSQAVVSQPALIPRDSLALVGSGLVGSFLDTYEFSLGKSGGISSVETRINISVLSEITPFGADLWSVFPGEPLPARRGDTGSHALLTNSFLLGSLVIRTEIGGSGERTLSDGVYGRSLSVPPVREANVWAMVLIAFSLVVFRLSKESQKANARQFA